MVSGYKNLTESRIYRQLLSLAENPFNLTGRGALEAQDRLAGYVCRTDLLELHYATERVDDRVMDGLQ